MTTRRNFLRTAAILPLMPQSILAGKGRPMDDFSDLDQRGNSTPLPRYLDRGLEDWLRAFREAERPDQTSEPCQALSCFGESLIQPALQAIHGVEDWKRVELVACIAATGRTAVPALLSLLENPSAVVCAAACCRLAEALDGRRNVSPIIGRALAQVLRRSESLTREGWRQAFDELEAAEKQAGACLLAGPDITAAIIAKTSDAHTCVRISALQALADLNCDDRLQGDVFHAIVSGLDDAEPDVRETAAASIYVLMIGRKLPAPQDDDVRTLVRSLDDPTPYVAKPIMEVLHALPGGPYMQAPPATDQTDCSSGERPAVRVHSGTGKTRNAVSPSIDLPFQRAPSTWSCR